MPHFDIHVSVHTVQDLADLAGSECVQNTNATGSTFAESRYINQGLLNLGKIISTLANQKDGYANCIGFNASIPTVASMIYLRRERC